MREIPLPHDQVALVDDQDYGLLSEFTWYVMSKGYVARGEWTNNHQTQVLMHRQIMGALPGQRLDHWNRNKLDNQRFNLRFATPHQNGGNRVSPCGPKSSRFKGVCWHKRAGKWMAHITVNYRFISLGLFLVEVDAAVAYNEAAARVFGEFALLNAV